MRRSLAPSRITPQTVTDEVINILNSTENHVKELKKLPGANIQPHEPAEVVEFSCVFGKKTTKKHKTYDSDGIIEIKNGMVILKSGHGNLMASGNALKHSVLDGAEISLGSFEVLVGEQLTGKPKILSPRLSKMDFTSSKRNTFKSPIVAVSPVAGAVDTVKKVQKFTVVWGPVSMKKHKTWEGDGVLEIIGNVARLRNEKGKIVATDFKLKSTDLEEGSRLVMEGKELEIIEPFIEEMQPQMQDTQRNLQNEPPPKCPRLSLPFKTPTVVEGGAEIPEIPVAQFERTVNYGSPDDCGSWSPTYETSSYSPSYSPLTSASGDPDVVCEPDASQFVLENKYRCDNEILLPPPPYPHQLKYNSKKVDVKRVVIPAKLSKLLRPHQIDGVRFLYEAVMGFNVVNSTDCYGAILADEMGLGKTIQCITLIYILLKQGPYMQPMAQNILIVTPSSLVDNWKAEFVKWLEHEKIYTFEVSAKNKPYDFSKSRHIPIMIVSYEMFVKQHEEINAINFDLMICDEGHRLKNSSIKVATLLGESSCQRRIILTGTPIQNDLEEFFNLINFVNPGVLGTYSEYKVHYEIPIVQSQQAAVLPEYKELGNLRSAELSEITNKFFLRRTQDINRQYLPPKQEVVVFCEPSQLQQRVITKILTNYHTQKSILPLQLITILKKVCNHPLLLREDEQYKQFIPPPQNIGMFESSKCELTYLILKEAIKRGEKIVLVSYFNQTLDLLAALCDESQFPFLRLDGTTPGQDRIKIVKNFNNPSSGYSVFLLSAKAGGAGLNLVGGSRLILFDNDWNPATDLQAMSRIWRDGQTRKVHIYRLITCGTIEEKIFQRQASKTSLGGRVMEHTKNQDKVKFSDEELRDLFSVPTDFTVCLTHESLSCDCQGNGDVPDGVSQEIEDPTDETDTDDENPFILRTKKVDNKSKKNRKTLQMHEFMKYEHHSAPVHDGLLKELCLFEGKQMISFIFRNQVNAATSQNSQILQEVDEDERIYEPNTDSNDNWSSLVDNDLDKIYDNDF